MEAILVVDDEPVVMKIVVQVLGQAGYTVLQATSPAEAFSIAETLDGSIALLITNHTLLNMTGRQIAERLLRTRPAMKVMHISGKPQKVLDSEGGLLPGAAFLQKPFLPKNLVAKVREVLTQS